MPRELTPQELAQLQIDTDYLDAGIPIYGSRVVMWGSIPVLIYHTANYGYTATDISDMGQAVIDQLAQQSDIHGMWYYLADSTQQVITERAEQVASVGETTGKAVEEIVQQVAQSTGNTLHDLLAPVVSSLTIPLVIAGVVLGIYLFKKG